ncbi:uncharacterized protein COX7B [Venturia canescens]|uniref:uncharacterized protein COX7B n=1 Tax=Venturia canescens TaxID=32260 RepID=UPI001C9CFF55|nr:uncharacterized protein LOC122411545 [Venturia canescens]
MFRQLLRPVFRNVTRRGTRQYHDEAANYKPGTMDELPIPQGSWQQQYDSKQTLYNMQLAFGILYAVGSIYYITQSGVIFFNCWPPVPKDEQK